MLTPDLVSRQHDGPIDPASAEALEADGLRLSRLRNDDAAEFEAWQAAVIRGFLGDEANAEHRTAGRELMAYRRLVAVLDDSAAQPEVPVGTLASWAGELSVPGGALVPSCAISSVTVAPTHRRRGIWRAMMTGELRTAAALGLPVASLTVSESMLYGRYGFALAASVASLVLDVKRAVWTGPIAPGRVDFISRESWRAQVDEVFDGMRPGRPGEFSMPGGHWDRFAGTRADAEKPGHTRAVQYRDAAGRVTGLALYAVDENHDDFTRSTVRLGYLLAADAEAYAGLWRFFVEMDLIGTLLANELSIDEPLLWMISDRRAATVTLRDHHYLRVLDVPAYLGARRYAASGEFVLDVSDPLGIAGGRFLLRIDADGRAVVAPSDDEPTVALGVAELAALSLGQVAATTLHAAGRLTAADPVALGRAFGWHESARLSHWY